MMNRKIIFILLTVFILTCFAQSVFAEEFTKLLIHSNTTDGSTTFEDSSDNNHQVSANGDVHHSTDQAKFGSSSIYFDGDGDYLTIPDSDDWFMGTGKFTIDFWVRPTIGANVYFFQQYTSLGHSIQFRWLWGYNRMEFTVMAGSGFVILQNMEGISLTHDTWSHIAFIRGWGGNVDNWAVCVNGTAVGTFTDSGAWHDEAAPFQIGAHNTRGTPPCHIDEFRVSKGVARWTANFTPPPIPYGNDKWYSIGYGIYSSGYVGIGTANPQSELAVNGTVTAKKVMVTDTGWSDFVFEDGYDLPSLEKIESYIKENKHLPDIPSEKEIKENGLSLSDILAKQMQKIEELTLYIIQLKKKNEALIIQDEELHKRVNALEKKR